MPPNDLLNGVLDTEFESPILDRLNAYSGQGSNNPLDVEEPVPTTPTTGTTGNLLDDLPDGGNSYPDGYVTYDAAGNEYVYQGGVRVATGNKRPDTTKTADTTGDSRIYAEADINAFASDPEVKSVTRQGPDVVVTYKSGATQRFYAVQGGYKAAAPTGGTAATAPKPTIADFFGNRGVASGEKFGSPQRFGDSNVILPHTSSGGGSDLSGYIYGENPGTGAPQLVGAHIGGQRFDYGSGTPQMVLAAYGVKPTGQLDQDLKTMSALVDMQTQALLTMRAMNPNATEAQAAAVVQAMLPKKVEAGAVDESLYPFDPLQLGMVQAEGGTNFAGVGGHSMLNSVMDGGMGGWRGSHNRMPQSHNRMPQVGIPVERGPMEGPGKYAEWNGSRPIPGGFYSSYKGRWLAGPGNGNGRWMLGQPVEDPEAEALRKIRDSRNASNFMPKTVPGQGPGHIFAGGGGFTTQEPIVMKGVESDNIYGVAGGQPERIDVTPLAGTDVMLGRELEEYALQQEQMKQGAAAGAGPIVDTFLRTSGKNQVPYRNTYFPA